jgi:hypothetical protein
VDDGGDANGTLDRLGDNARGSRCLLVRRFAAPATVDGGDDRREQLEVGPRDAGVSQHVHAQPGGQAKSKSFGQENTSFRWTRASSLLTTPVRENDGE